MTIEVGKYGIFGMPPYFFFSVLGFAIGISCYMVLLLISNIQISKKNLFLCLFAIVGVFLGARFFGCLTNIAISLYKNEKIGIDVIYRAGLVFYGGLFGSVFFYWIGLCVLFQKKRNMSLINAFAVVIPLFHLFGRLGCLFAGCCYGKEYHGFGHIDYIRDGITTSTFPVQLLEAVMELCLFCFLFVKYCINKKNTNKNMLIIYLILYSAGRFFMEFFRGDPNRGSFRLLSFSQIISIMILVFGIIFSFRKRGKYENC